MSTTAQEVAATPAAPARGPARKGGAAFVAAGILLSRLAGLVRQSVFGHYLGTSDAADAYNAAFKIPNFLQNLLGEGVLSASFIPVYASLRAQGDEEEARKVAGAVAGLLSLVTTAFTVVGVAATPYLIDAIAPGFSGDKRALTILLVRIFFPGTALLVLSAFCLGVLNSHHRFFLSYVAPVVWSAAQIAALILGGRGFRMGPFDLAVVTAWGAVVGALLQVGVQLPAMLSCLGGRLRLSLGRANAHVRDVVRSFFPVVAGRGVVQLSAYIDNVIASWLPSGAVAALAYAQTLYTLPISLFGMSISAASLPSMSAAQGTREALHKQLSSGLRAIAFPVVPTVIAFLAFGDVAVAALFRSGRFSADDVRYVWMILAGSTVGLLAATQARLYSSTFYALRDTRTPLKYAAIRVALTAGLGVAAGLWLPRAFHLDSRLGAVGLTASAGVAGWIEYALLRRGISVRVGPAALPGGLLARLWGAAIIAGAIGLGVKFALAGLGASRLAALVRAAAVFGAFGVSYLLGCLLLEVPEAAGSLQRVRRLLKR
ncbi:MAG: murein biosynthesis integral membrane protein MurJ [Deltaproteobacteria bacterium]|nr:MAG: murein biosynthesis integral membrane protein MurJ [Deltaproteobacteria bacterium]